MNKKASQILEIEQGSPEWHALRKTKITATDAAIIMGASPWKTRAELYAEKKSNEAPKAPTERMQRGIDLEPIARDLFCKTTRHRMIPKVVIKEWAMASLDGINAWNEVLEVKCPGEKDHSIARSGKVPDHYYPQLQHQMYVCDSEKAFYYSFDGSDGVIVEVERDDKYIEKMLTEEKKFYDCLLNDTPPPPSEDEYILRDDPIWVQASHRLIDVRSQIEKLQEEEEELKKALIFLSGERNSKGGGISLCQVQRKGNIDYAKIPELKGVYLEKYRKSSINSWRITCSA